MASFFTTSGIENDSIFGQFHSKKWMFSLQILEEKELIRALVA